MYNSGNRQTKEDELINHMKTAAGGGAPSPTGAAAATTTGNSTRGGARAGLDELFEGGDRGGANTGYPRQSSPAGQEVNENLRRALRISESTQSTGYATMQSLGRQREVIQNSLHTVDSTHQHLQESQQTIRSIRFQVYKEWCMKGCVLLALVAVIVLLFWSKFLRKH